MKQELILKDELPDVSVEASGSLEIVDNLEVFERALRDLIDNQLITSPQTDQDFIDLDKQIKKLEKAEDALDKAETKVLSMVSAVDTFKKTKDLLHTLARDNRLMAQKLLKTEKENRRTEIKARGEKALNEHVAQINATLGGITLPRPEADFDGAIKNKRTITSLNESVDAELSRAKIKANECADKIRLNLETLRIDTAEYDFLFSDKQQLVAHDNAHLKLLIKSRIDDRKAADAAKLEADREKIRAEERAKLDADMAAKKPTEPVPETAPPPTPASAGPAKAQPQAQAPEPKAPTASARTYGGGGRGSYSPPRQPAATGKVSLQVTCTFVIDVSPTLKHEAIDVELRRKLAAAGIRDSITGITIGRAKSDAAA